MSRCTEDEMSGRVRDYGDRGRRGTFGNEVRERPSGEGEHLCGSLAEDETAGRTEGRTGVASGQPTPDRAEGRAVLYTNMYGEWIK